MDLDAPPQPRRQYAVLLQDESESATQSFGGSGGDAPPARPASAPAHARRPPAVPPPAVADAGAGASATGPAPHGSQPSEHHGSPTAAAGTAGTAAWQQLHARLSGHKHRREQPAAAPAPSDAAKSGGRNGSDSGSNSPGDGTPVPDSQMGPDRGDAPPPAKMQRSG